MARSAANLLYGSRSRSFQAAPIKTMRDANYFLDRWWQITRSGYNRDPYPYLCCRGQYLDDKRLVYLAQPFINFDSGQVVWDAIYLYRSRWLVVIGSDFAEPQIKRFTDLDWACRILSSSRLRERSPLMSPERLVVTSDSVLKRLRRLAIIEP